MEPSQPRRNPSRSARPANCIDEWWDPHGTRLDSDVDRQIQRLNGEAYPADIFGRVDDLLMFTLFATKQASQPKKRRHHAVIPQQVSNRPMLTRDEGARAAKICRALVSGNDASMDEVHAVVSELQREIALFQSPERQWVPCLGQCAEFRCSQEAGSESSQVCFTDTPFFTPREARWPSARSRTGRMRCRLASRLAATYLKAPISRRRAALCRRTSSSDRLHLSSNRLLASWANRVLGSSSDRSDL
jgi:hypothetical protein